MGPVVHYIYFLLNHHPPDVSCHPPELSAKLVVALFDYSANPSAPFTELSLQKGGLVTTMLPVLDGSGLVRKSRLILSLLVMYRTNNGLLHVLIYKGGLYGVLN